MHQEVLHIILINNYLQNTLRALAQVQGSLFRLQEEDGGLVEAVEGGVEAAVHEEVAAEGFAVAPPAAAVHVLFHNFIG